jgi:hypothetical protein
MDEVATFALTDAGQHVEAWSDMLSASDPPILSTPISPFLGEHAFRSEFICESACDVANLKLRARYML